MSALIAHAGLTPKVGETFTDQEGVKWLVKVVEPFMEDQYDVFLKSENYEDWFRIDSQMLVNYALTRRPATR